MYIEMKNAQSIMQAIVLHSSHYSNNLHWKITISKSSLSLALTRAHITLSFSLIQQIYISVM